MSFKRHKKTAHLREIVAVAKKIRKGSPKKKWTTCMKEASKKLYK